MFKAKILIAAAAIAVPSMASACSFHGGFGTFAGFGGMHYSNMSLLSDRGTARNSNRMASADHSGGQGMRHVRFGSGDGFDDVEDDAATADDAESAYNPDDAATFR